MEHSHPRPLSDTILETVRALSAPPPWSIGLGCALVGYSACGLGLNLIRLSHVKSNPPATLHPTRWNRKSSAKHSRAIWALGYLLQLAGGALNLCALRFAAQSLIAPLSSVALVVNLLFATALLGERFSARDVLPLLIIVFGNCLAVSSASHRRQEALTLAQIADLFARRPFRIWLLLVAAAASVLMVAHARIRAAIRRSGGAEFASPTLLARAGLCHAAAAAMLCVQMVLLGKGAILVLAGGVGAVLFKPQFALLLLSWVSLALFWVFTLNTLLANHDCLFVVPVIEVCWSVLSLTSGGIFFAEYSQLSQTRFLVFALGCVMNVYGVWRLTRRGEKEGKIG